MNVLITGGAGFIGSHLCERMLFLNHFVTCLDDFSSGSIWNVRHLLDNPDFRLAKGSILDRPLLDRIMCEMDVVFHLAAQVHVDRSYVEPELTYEVNVKGTQNILELARWHRLKKVVYASSSEVYGTAQYTEMDEEHPLDAPHPYGASKIAADRMCYAYAMTFKLPVVIVRCFNLYGPRQKDFGYGGVVSLFMRRALLGEPLQIYGDGLQSRDYTYVSDAINFYTLCLHDEIGIGPYNVGTGYDITVKDLAEKINIMCGSRSQIVSAPARLGEVRRLHCDSSLAQAAGWCRKVNLSDGLNELFAWFQTHGTDR